nr:hypothetical protein [Nostoc sp. FACHB-190]
MELYNCTIWVDGDRPVAGIGCNGQGCGVDAAVCVGIIAEDVDCNWLGLVGGGGVVVGDWCYEVVVQQHYVVEDDFGISGTETEEVEVEGSGGSCLNACEVYFKGEGLVEDKVTVGGGVD